MDKPTKFVPFDLCLKCFKTVKKGHFTIVFRFSPLNLPKTKIYIMRLNKFTAGILAGGIMGVLFAPAKGSESRKTISNLASSIKAGFDKLFGNSHDELEELKKLLDDQTVELTEKDRKKLVQLIEENQRILKELEA